MTRVTWIVGLALCLPVAASAQETVKEPEPLFRSREPLAITIKAPFKQLFKNRDTINVKPVSGTVEFTDATAGPVTLPITLETRGHFRLKPGTCSFAPLKVRFDKEKTKGTVFAKQGSLKLTTHCQNNPRFEQDLLVEEGIYRMFNLLTPLSHRTRLAKVLYIPTDDTTKTITRYGFFTETDEAMAKRNGGVLMKQTGGKFDDIDQPYLDLVMLFEYFIGNTDWSIYMVHNFRIVNVTERASYYAVAYDFDFSGLVNASYAIPDGRLPIKSVRQRLYRGPCKTIDELRPTLELYTAKKDSLYAALQSVPDLDPKRLKEATDYMDEFFKEIKNPKDFDGALGYACKNR